VGSAGFHNAAVHAARLLHQKKHRLERRCFLIEGPLLVRAALDAGARIEQVFVLDEEGAAPALGATAAVPTTQVLRVDARTLESLSQTKTPQGMVAVVGFVDREARAIARLIGADGPALVLVLPTLSDPGNAGTLVRSAEAFGARAGLRGKTEGASARRFRHGR